MSYNQAEKFEIIKMVESSPLPAKQTLKQIKVSKSSFYKWYKKYKEGGYDGLANKNKTPYRIWNRIPDEEREKIVEVALDHPEESPREISYRFIDMHRYFISESSVYRILKAKNLTRTPVFEISSAKDKFEDPTTGINQLWQTDFTYFKVINWGWYYLSTVMDDYSRYILSWKLCKTMKTEDVIDTIELARQNSSINNVPVISKTGLLSDNGSCYISKALQEYLESKEMWHTRGKPYHPQTQGKIERYHRSMKNLLLLNKYYTPGELEEMIAAWVTYYNTQRYHEGIDNVTPEDMYLGRAEEILKRRKDIKRMTMTERRINYLTTLNNSLN